jgi:hypothetical protein
MDGVDRRQLLHDEAEESLDAYYRRHAARSWQEYLASSPEALAERAAERLPLEAETVAAVETLFKRHFHRPVETVLERHGFLYRDLCYEHHCSEFDELPSASRWRASTWHTVEKVGCEMCGKDLD